MGKVMIVCYRSKRGRTNRNPKDRCRKHAPTTVETVEELNATIKAFIADRRERPGLLKRLLWWLTGETGDHWLLHCDESGNPLPDSRGTQGSSYAAWEHFRLQS